MLPILIFFNSLLGFALTAATYTFHLEGKIKHALFSVCLLALTIANVVTMTF